MNLLLHDTADRLRRAQHPDTVVSHHCLIRLIVSHNRAQQHLTWDDLITALERGENLPIPNPIPKRKRTVPSRSIPHKLRQFTMLNSFYWMPKNPQGNTNQPTESSSPVNIQDSEPESEG